MIKIEWNIANILTMFRILLVPVIIVLILLYTPFSLILAFILFILSSVTDILDGHLARKYSLQSEFGAYWDPLADKILTLGVFIVLIFIPELHIYWWMVLLFLLRDVCVTLIRNYFKKHQYKFTTSMIAKAKTAIQMSALGIILFYLMYTRIQSSMLNIEGSSFSEIWQALGVKNIDVIIQIPFLLTLIAVIFTIYSSLKYITEFTRLINKDI